MHNQCGENSEHSARNTQVSYEASRAGPTTATDSFAFRFINKATVNQCL